MPLRRSGPRTAARIRRRRSRRTRRSRGRAARPSPPTMFSPTASSAITSASIPTCSWNPPRPSSGSAAPARPASASLRPPADPLELALRVAAPGRQVLAPVCLPGDPLVGPDLRAGCGGGCGSRLILGRHTFCSCAWPSSPLGRTSITAIRMPEHEQVRVRRGDVAGDEGLRDADQQSAEHRARQRADPADDGRRESLQAGDEADRVRRPD